MQPHPRTGALTILAVLPTCVVPDVCLAGDGTLPVYPKGGQAATTMCHNLP